VLFIVPTCFKGLQIVKHNDINYHSYADDTQIYMAFDSDDNSSIDALCHCIEQIKTWMNLNFLQLNQDKTENLDESKFFTTKPR